MSLFLNLHQVFVHFLSLSLYIYIYIALAFSLKLNGFGIHTYYYGWWAIETVMTQIPKLNVCTILVYFHLPSFYVFHSLSFLLLCNWRHRHRWFISLYSYISHKFVVCSFSIALSNSGFFSLGLARQCCESEFGCVFAWIFFASIKMAMAVAAKRC